MSGSRSIAPLAHTSGRQRPTTRSFPMLSTRTSSTSLLCSPPIWLSASTLPTTRLPAASLSTPSSCTMLLLVRGSSFCTATWALGLAGSDLRSRRRFQFGKTLSPRPKALSTTATSLSSRRPSSTWVSTTASLSGPLSPALPHSVVATSVVVPTALVFVSSRRRTGRLVSFLATEYSSLC